TRRRVRPPPWRLAPAPSPRLRAACWPCSWEWWGSRWLATGLRGGQTLLPFDSRELFDELLVVFGELFALLGEGVDVLVRLVDALLHFAIDFAKLDDGLAVLLVEPLVLFDLSEFFFKVAKQDFIQFLKFLLDVLARFLDASRRLAVLFEIGRASCRERVWLCI